MSDLFSYLCRVTGDNISQYKETCDVLLYYPKIGGYDIKYSVKNTIRNILHPKIDINSRRLIAEFQVDGVKCVANHQSHCANITFSDKRVHLTLADP